MFDTINFPTFATERSVVATLSPGLEALLDCHKAMEELGGLLRF
jgi:hypothetical protein